MFAESRVHGLNTTFSNAFTTGLQLPTEKREGLRPSFSTHVRETPRTWGTRPGVKGCEQARGLSHYQRMTLTFHLGSQAGRGTHTLTPEEQPQGKGQ